MKKLKIYSIFESISGEAGGFPQGSWCTFIRLNGCNLSCYWCDTPRANEDDYVEYTPSDLLTQCRTKRVLITGGEPLMQKPGLIELINLLAHYGHLVQVETNGSYAIPVICGPISWVIDYKCPSSGMHNRMRELDFLADNIHELRKAGNAVHLKWVVSSLEDIYFAMDRIQGLREIVGHPFNGPHIISPVNACGAWIGTIRRHITSYMGPGELDFIIFSIQLHKIVKMP